MLRRKNKEDLIENKENLRKTDDFVRKKKFGCQ